MLRYAGGRELTLGDLGTEAGMLGGINAIIVGNYLTTLGRPAQQDLDMLSQAPHAHQGPVFHPLTLAFRAVRWPAGTDDTWPGHYLADPEPGTAPPVPIGAPAATQV